MKARLVNPVKHDLSSRSSVFTPIAKTEILTGKILPGTGILSDTGISLEGGWVRKREGRRKWSEYTFPHLTSNSFFNANFRKVLERQNLLLELLACSYHSPVP